MVLQPKETTLAYRCPKCGATVVSMVGIFALSGDMIRLKCSCGGSELTAAYTPERKVRLFVPCLLCPRPHQYLLSSASFFEKRILTLDCPESGVPVCFIGGKDEVLDAAKAADEELMAMLAEAGLDDFDMLRQENSESSVRPPDEDDLFLWDVINFLLCELEDDDAISCRCEDNGEQDIDFELGRDEESETEFVRIYCKSCGAGKTVTIPDAFSARQFLQTDSLELE